MFKGSRRDREGSEKRALLRKMIDNEGDKCTNAIVFCNRKTDVDIVAKSLKKYGYDAAPIHGDLDQSQRTRTLDGFREGSLRFLIASDVAARGLDVPAVSHVFNFDVPSHAEDYVHRIGRTGRAGRDGKAMMICSPRDEKNFDAIERLLQKAIPRLENPLGSVVADADEDVSETPREPKSRRARGGRGRSKPSDAPKVEVAKVEAVAETKPREQTREAEKPRQQARESEQSRQQTTSETPRNNNNRDRRNDRGGRDNTVVGMGDHMPSFIAMSFDERRAS
jgi:ATP-dependent RNA helicase RhlE